MAYTYIYIIYSLYIYIQPIYIYEYIYIYTMPIWSHVQISSSTDTIRPNRPIFSPRLYDFNLNGFGTFDSSLHAEVHLDVAKFDPRGKFWDFTGNLVYGKMLSTWNVQLFWQVSWWSTCNFWSQNCWSHYFNVCFYGLGWWFGSNGNCCNAEKSHLLEVS
jgi:hypothetical protein